jgi:2-oxoisovalerate dehydrogenase E1 component
MKELNVMPDFSPSEILLPPIPIFQYKTPLSFELAKGMTKETLLDHFYCMALIRSFEECIVKMKQGSYKPLPDFTFVGATHLSIGQEAVASGIMGCLFPDDYITSTHRGHGHSIAKGFYFINKGSDQALETFLSDYRFEQTEDLKQMALDHHVYKAFCELFGKDDGYCRGRGGGMHIADFNMGHLGANAIVGGSYAMAVGAALGSAKLGTKRVTVCLVGDGATNNGIAHEAMNFAVQEQFEKKLPIIFAIENNQYGMTGQSIGEVCGVKYLAQRGAGYNNVNMNAEVVNGMDLMAVRDSARRAINRARQGDGPTVLEYITYRYYGHSLSDKCNTYRTKQEEDAWRALDPLNSLAASLVEQNLISQSEMDALREQADAKIELAAKRASEADYPTPDTIEEGLLSNTKTETVPPEFVPQNLPESKLTPRDGEGRILARHAVAEAIKEEMSRDSRVIFYGEDVADYGGAFQASRGLLDYFGRDRVFNAPISEAAIIGTGCGAAMVGMRPIVELMYIDFVLMTMDQLGNQVAKNRYMFGGKAKIPLVIRTTIGGGKGYAGQHSQSLESVVAHFPGIKIVAPYDPYDLKGLLKTAIRDDDPVFFIEHQLLYTEKGPVPTEEYTIPFGEAKIRQAGTDVTVISYSYMLKRVLEAADIAAEQGISIEVIDLRTLFPLDLDTILTSVQKTGRLVLVTQSPLTCSFNEHIVYQVQKEGWESLRKPAQIVSGYSVPPPMSPTLEAEHMASGERIVASIKHLME